MANFKKKALTLTNSVRWEHYLHIMAALLVVLVTIGVFFLRGMIKNPRSYGYLGIFILSFMGSATILLPVPGVAAVLAGGWLLNPLFVALLAGIGEALGEVTGYMLGYSGREVLEGRALYRPLKEWMARRGYITLFAFSVVPNPVFDVVGVMAGALRFPLWKFLLICLAGKTIKSLGIAFAGDWGLDWAISYFHQFIG